MPVTETRRSPEEVAQLGVEALEQKVRPALRPDDDGKFVAIDVGTGDFEIDDDDYLAVVRLRKRSAGAEIWLGRVGAPAAYCKRRLPRAVSPMAASVRY